MIITSVPYHPSYSPKKANQKDLPSFSPLEGTMRNESPLMSLSAADTVKNLRLSRSIKASPVSFGAQSFLSGTELLALNRFFSRIPDNPRHTIIFSDHRRDPDDEVTSLISNAAQRYNAMKLKATIETLGSEEVKGERAEFADFLQQILSLGLGREAETAPIAIGTASPSMKSDGDSQKIIKNESLRPLGSVNVHPDAQALLTKMLNDPLVEDHSLTPVVTSGMTDLAACMRNNPEAFTKKVKEIYIQAGATSKPDERGFYGPDTEDPEKVKNKQTSYNNEADREAAKEVFEFVQAHNIPTILVPKQVAYQIPVGMEFYQELQTIENKIDFDGVLGEVLTHPIGDDLCKIQKASLEHLWQGIEAGKIPRTPEWFLSFFTSVKPESEEGQKIIEDVQKQASNFDEVWKKVDKLYLYDPCALLASLNPATSHIMETKPLGESSCLRQAEITDSKEAKLLLTALAKKALVDFAKPVEAVRSAKDKEFAPLTGIPSLGSVYEEMNRLFGGDDKLIPPQYYHMAYYDY